MLDHNPPQYFHYIFHVSEPELLERSLVFTSDLKLSEGQFLTKKVNFHAALTVVEYWTNIRSDLGLNLKILLSSCISFAVFKLSSVRIFVLRSYSEVLILGPICSD